MFRIAIITPNTLVAIGLRHLLHRMIPALGFESFMSIEEVERMPSDTFVHFFVDQLLLDASPTFLHRHPHRVISLVADGTLAAQGSHAPVLVMNQPQSQLLQVLLQMMRHGHKSGHNLPDTLRGKDEAVLTLREKEVLEYVAKGYINKEIASALHISPTTVVTHRKNITGKLNIKSVSGLTLYAVLHGLVDPQSVLVK